MKTTISALALLGVLLAAATPALACRWFGSQLECDLGGRHVVIGTQTETAPRYGRTFRPQSLRGDDALLGDRERTVRAFETIRVQDVGTDPSLCRRIGNETYCY